MVLGTAQMRVCVCILICCLERWVGCSALLPNYVSVSFFTSSLMETILINYSCVCVFVCTSLSLCLFSHLVEMCLHCHFHVFHVFIFWEMYSSLTCHDKWSDTDLFINPDTLNIFTCPWPAAHCYNSDEACLESPSIFLDSETKSSNKVVRQVSTELSCVFTNNVWPGWLEDS